METKTIHGIEYVTDGALSGGDFGGMGYIARVNVEVLEKIAEDNEATRDFILHTGFDLAMEQDVESEYESACEANPNANDGLDLMPALIVCGGGYNSVEAFVRADCVELVEAVESLDLYPVLCDDSLSEAEMKLEDEAWVNYIAADVRREIDDLIDDDDEDAEALEILLDDMTIDDFQMLFHDGCEAENVYREVETDGGVFYHGLPEIAAHMLETVRIDTDPTPQGCIRRASRDGLIDDLFTTA